MIQVTWVGTFYRASGQSKRMQLTINIGNEEVPIEAIAREIEALSKQVFCTRVEGEVVDIVMVAEICEN